jgi:hypothetical protein
MTPLDDGDSGQAKNRKTGKCRDMLVFQDMMKYNVMDENYVTSYRRDESKA